MNDYYSNFPQPTADIRAKNVLEFTQGDFKRKIPHEKLQEIALEVVSASPEYSLTGYRMAGFNEEIKRFEERCVKFSG